MPDNVRLLIDGVEYSVPKGMNVVDAAKTIGNDIPVFCYHPKMAPVGMCRMCLVEMGQADIDKETGAFKTDDKGGVSVRWQPKLATACTATVTDGMALRTNTQQVEEARDDIIEFLLTSHPLDCPICDKGGECPLQNLTLRHGPGVSRFVFDEKMDLAKHYPLGDLIYLDRERCIQCARCTRFQEELVGDAVLGFHQRGRYLQIVTTSTPEFDTYFSGNTTDICPVGALTTADFRFGARPWELTEVPSICPHCSVGCNISASTRLDRDAGGKTIIKRIMPRQNEQVNEIWLCDKGRFGHHHARANDRLLTPMIRKGGKLVPATWQEAYALVAQKVAAANGSVGAIAGGMLSNEDLWELRRNVEAGGSNLFGVYPYNMGGEEYAASVGLAKGSNFTAMGKGTTIIVVASNLEEEAPIWYLRVKGAADRGANLVTVNMRYTELDRFAKRKIRYNYGADIDALQSVDVSDAENLVIIVGGEGENLAGHKELMKAAASILIGTGKAGKVNSGLLPVWHGANLQGAFDLGYTAEATQTLLANPPAVLFLADADVIGEDAEHQNVLDREGGFTVVTSMFMTATAQKADVVLPRQSFAERDGSFTNGERRVQRFYAAQSPMGDTRPDWKMFTEVLALLNASRKKLSAAAVMQEITQQVPRYADMSYANLGKIEKQFPDVGGADLYYGGTAYENKGGLGVQWAVSAETERPAFVLPPDPAGASALPEGQLLIVPIIELYDRNPTFAASDHLMHEHIDAPYVLLNPADAAKLGIAADDVVAVSVAGQTIPVKARVDAKKAAQPGLALFPRSLVNQPAALVPMAGTVSKVEMAETAAR
jgi:NADH-quinone oxidoreductase subunit G